MRVDNVRWVDNARADNARVDSVQADNVPPGVTRAGVTRFLRDPDVFATLACDVLPKLLAACGAGDTLRIWVPGCATGEEAYSIALLLCEAASDAGAHRRLALKVFATDIDAAALRVARTGRYPLEALAGLSAARRARFFVTDRTGAVVSDELRDMCVFSTHSVAHDLPFSRVDMIACRNVLAPFDAALRRHVLRMFHYALRPDGCLLLGAAETAAQCRDLFAPSHLQQRLFTRLPATDTIAGRRPPIDLLHTASPAPPGRDQPRSRPPLQQIVQAHMLAWHAPAHVAVDGAGRVVFGSDGIGRYLQAGAPPLAEAVGRQIVAVIHADLRHDLRAALHQALLTRERVSRGPVWRQSGGGTQRLLLTVEPLDSSAERLFLVVFADDGAAAAGVVPGQAGNDRAGIDRVGAVAGHIAQPEFALADGHERRQRLVDDYAAALEELRSANEELQTSGEELVSLNEELQGVNAELGLKLERLDEASGDLHSVLESTRVATIFLGPDLVIRSFTPAATQIFALIPADRGRPLTDIASRLAYPTLPADIAAVLATATPLERSVREQPGQARDGGAHYLARLQPYLRAGLPNGVVVTFIDVTSLAHAEAQQRRLVAELNHLVKNMLTVVIGLATLTQAHASAVEGSVEAFAEAFIERLYALSQAYELVMSRSWSSIAMRELVLEGLRPYRLAGADRVVAEGADVMLPAKTALSLGMVLNELATNAVKYGALSVAGGGVAVRWAIAPDAADAAALAMEVDWHEHGGPAVTPQPEPRFGLKMIRQEIEYGLGGTIGVAFAAGGLRAVLRFPVGDAGVAQAGP